MFWTFILLTLNQVLGQNIAFKFGKSQNQSTLKSDQNFIDPYFQNKKILSEIFIDLGDNNKLSENEILTTTSISSSQQAFTFSKNVTSNNSNSTSNIRSLKNRDIRFLFKSKNESNKFLKANSNDNSFLSIYNIVENRTNYMVIKMNKELLILVASISSIFLIAFTVLTFLCKCIRYPHGSISNNKNGYSPCRYH
jgi:hypothetical protein